MAQPLTKRNSDGVLYTRPPAVETAIDLALKQDPACLNQRIQVLNQDSSGFLSSECLVHLIRDSWRRGDEELMSALIATLLVRCEKTLKAKVPDGRLPNAEQIRENILGDFSLLFIEDGSNGNTNELDYFECRFNLAFRSFYISCVRLELACLGPLEPLPVENEGAHGSDEIPFTPVPELLRTPATQITDTFWNERLAAINNLPPDERKAVILCGVLGYKEESDDPSITTAATLCGVTGRTIRNRLKRAAASLPHFKEGI
jgi:hypothetical protein